MTWKQWKYIGAAGVALALALMLVVVVLLLNSFSAAESVKLPLLAILGIVFLLGTLALVSMVFQILELDDKTQALALPEGSIRAVIALSLIVLFAILSVYLYGGIASSKVAVAQHLDRVQMTAFRQAIGTELISVTPDPATAKEDAEFTVVFRDRNPAADDFAKQMLTLLGTLMTAVTSFYFASKAVAAAQAGPEDAPPKITSLTPATLTAGSEAEQLTVNGTNLNSVKSVSLQLGPDSIRGGNVLSNDGVVTAAFQLAKDTKTGHWDVYIEDGSGRSDRRPQAVEIVAGPPN